MTRSRTTHGALTEPVCKTMSGKGREGNKEGKGREEGGSCSPHRLVGDARIGQPRAGHLPDVMVSATRLDERVDVQTIEHLDFPVACEHTEHHQRHPEGESAAYIVTRSRPCGCPGGRNRYALCHSGWRLMGRGHVRCIVCGAESARDDVIHIVEVLP